MPDLDLIRGSPYRPAASERSHTKALQKTALDYMFKWSKTSCITDGNHRSDGEHATLNGQPLATSQTTDLSQAMVYINEADKLMRDEPDVFRRLNTAGRDRRYSYDCYPHALVAAGHVDACIDFDLKPYDILPLVPIVAAAGGVITDWQGQPLGLNSDGRVVTAATPALHAQLLDLINQA